MGENRNLFETAGDKQVGADFKPAPDKIKVDPALESAAEAKVE